MFRNKSAGYYVNTKYGNVTANIYFSRTKNQSPYAKVTFSGNYESGMGFTVSANLNSYGFTGDLNVNIVCTLYGDGSMITNMATFSFTLSSSGPNKASTYSTTGKYYKTWEISIQPTKVGYSPKTFIYNGETVNISVAKSISLPI